MVNNDQITKYIEVKGLVQGVGFRPFIYRLAKKHQLGGWVVNTNEGVKINVNGRSEKIDDFIKSIKNECPPASNIVSIKIKALENQKFDEFSIVKSKDSSRKITEISPDISVCKDCLNDMNVQADRINYPFINCTNCGPRFTIIKDLPYDRIKTTMREFIMCDACSSEYDNILDRRFHAQPVACEKCGPQYKMIIKNQVLEGTEKIIKKFAEFIDNGKIVALKGMGGFHFSCDASNQNVVSRLRNNKNREGKPFAVMFPDLNTLKEYAHINYAEEKRLLSWQRPIILLKHKKTLAYDVCVGFETMGVMMPYMPIHYLIFQKLKCSAIVLTSGNISDEPIVIDNETAISKLGKISDAVIINNREIYNRTDDSIEMIASDKARIIRRSRGFTPSPVRLNLNLEGIFAAGAELVNCFCIGKGNQAIMSQHIGDLKNIETLEFYEESIRRFKRLFRFEPDLIVSDLHPDYLSSRYARELNGKQIQVQHHHAHIASCMAEYGIDEKVLGVCFDGTGLGDDNNIWGGEFFICDLYEYERISHFENIALPGGDRVAEEPWRMAVSYLLNSLGEIPWEINLPFLSRIDKTEVELLQVAIRNKINSPLSSSAGRLFDAVAALCNICCKSSFHAEAPMRLESIADFSVKDEYDYILSESISFSLMIKQIICDLETRVPIPEISAKFHNTIISVIFATVKMWSDRSGINKVVLSGGVFQNRYLLENCINLLSENNYEVYTQSSIPSNDGGIALGQIAIAAKRRNIKCV